tara:strand:+ start:736 stop:1167 length:432 start_codon:yes stop_codon:yes gene_type:complete
MSNTTVTNEEFVSKVKDLSGNDFKDAVREEKRKQIIQLVCRQTDYTTEEAEAKLKEHKGNYMSVVKEYLNPKYKEENKKKVEEHESKSNNQKIYTEIRGFMDNAVKGYEYRKKVTEIINKKREELLVQQQQQQQENKKIDEKK